MYRSPTLRPDQIDYLYSELACVAVVSAEPQMKSRAMKTSLHHLLEQRAELHGEHAALTYKAETSTYDELWHASRRVAAGLVSLGLERDDRVAVFLDKRIETVTSIFGISAAGGVFVPVNPLLRPQQVSYILRDCSVRILITTAERLQALEDELEGCPSLESVVIVGGERKDDEPSEGATGLRTHSWDELTSSDARFVPYAAVDLDMAAILYTSGSTGMPKGVVLSHRNLIVGGESVSQYIGNTSDDVILAALPLSFDAGFSQLTTGFYVGAHVVLMNYLLPADVVRLCARHGVTGPHVRASPVDPDRRASVAGRRGTAASLLRKHRRAHAQAHTRQAARAVSAGASVPHVRAHRSIPLDVPRPIPGRPAT